MDNIRQAVEELRDDIDRMTREREARLDAMSAKLDAIIRQVQEAAGAGRASGPSL